MEKKSRRTFLKLLASTGTVGIATYALHQTHIGNLLSNEQAAKDDFLGLGPEKEMSFEKHGILHTPDTRIPFFTNKDGHKVFFLSGNASSFTLTGDAQPKEPLPRNPKFVLGPDRSKTYRNGYSTINSILQLDPTSSDHLFGVTHYEQWQLKNNQLTYENYTGSIGLVESLDGGSTWQDLGPIIAAADALPPGKKVTGVGQPCAMVKEENGQRYIYVYYLYLPSYENAPYEICLSKALVENGRPGGKFKPYNGQFSDDLVSPNTIKPVIIHPKEVANSGYAALPSISYNKHLNKYLAIFETQAGFCTATSEDGINWGDYKLVFRFPSGQYPHFEGQTWYSNPTLLSLDEPTDQITNNKGIFVYSKGTWPKPHELKFKAFSLTA